MKLIPRFVYNEEKAVIMVMAYCNLGEVLRKLRKGRGMTQTELGNQVGLSKAVVSKYETGIGYPTFDVLIRIAQFFGVSTDYLLGISGSRTLDITGLTESQADTLNRLVAEFRQANSGKGNL